MPLDTNLLPVLQIRGPCRDYAFAAYERVHQIASGTLALNVNIAAESLAVEGEQNELLPIFIAQGGGGNEDIGLFRDGALVVVGLRFELNGGIHFRAQVGIGFAESGL